MRHREGDTPVPGYTLRAPLGDGPRGEVWRADGPGGAASAVRFLLVQGEGAGRALRDAATAERYRHPHLVPVLAAWVRDEAGTLLAAGDDPAGFRPAGAAQLVVVTPLADGSLADPPPDLPSLLRSLADAARGLDFLADPPGLPPLPHADLRPTALLRFGDAVRVSGYGLRPQAHLDPVRGLAAGPGTFDAPEAINSTPGAGTDQYSLAVIYYHLRTGRPPVDEAAGRRDHLLGRLDFSLVPEAERAVLRRATALNPTDRYPTCGAFVAALTEAADGTEAALTRTDVFPEIETHPPPAAVRRPTPRMQRVEIPAAAAPAGKARASADPAGYASAETLRESQTVSRRATVRLYDRMAPERSYPLLVVLSAADIAAVVQAGVKQTRGDGFEVDADAVLEVEPVLPGCQVYPPRELLAAADELATARFWVVPHVLGRVNGAKVVVRRAGRVVSEVTLDVKVRKQTLTVLLGLAGMASPYLMAGLRKLELDPASQQARGYPVIQQLTAWAVDALRPDLVAAALLLAAGACYLLLRPKRRDVFWDVTAEPVNPPAGVAAAAN